MLVRLKCHHFSQCRLLVIVFPRRDCLVVGDELKNRPCLALLDFQTVYVEGRLRCPEGWGRRCVNSIHSPRGMVCLNGGMVCLNDCLRTIALSSGSTRESSPAIGWAFLFSR